MYTKRIIPCLDVRNGRVVKGTNFVGLRDAGDPVELAARYDKEGADELVFLDITASHEERSTIVQVAKACASEMFIPFTVGGGIRTPEDIRRLLKSGADKVSFNTAAVSMHALILPEDSPVVGKRVHSLALPARSVLAALLRDGRPITPSADDVFEASDELLLLVPDADTAELEDLRQLVASPVSEESDDEEGEE